MMRAVLTVSAGLAAALTLASAGAGLAQDLIDDPIAERQQRMDTIGDAARTGGQMIRGEAPFDAVAATQVFTDMNAAITGFGELFPEGTETGGKTSAAPAIFEDRAGFQEQVDLFEQRTAQAEAAAPQTLEDFRAQFGEVSQSCRSCHEDYRVNRN